MFPPPFGDEEMHTESLQNIGFKLFVLLEVGAYLSCDSFWSGWWFVYADSNSWDLSDFIASYGLENRGAIISAST